MLAQFKHKRWQKKWQTENCFTADGYRVLIAEAGLFFERALEFDGFAHEQIKRKKIDFVRHKQALGAEYVKRRVMRIISIVLNLVNS